MVQASMVQKSFKMRQRGRVGHADENLRTNSEHENQRDDRRQREPLARRQVLPARPAIAQRPAEHPLQNGQEEYRRDEQTEGRNRRRPARQRQNALEDQKFADKSIQAGQTDARRTR